MRERGIITRSVSGKIVEVAFQRSEACAKCKLCHDVAENLAGIEAVDDIGARVGDEVEIDIPSEAIVKGSMIVFLLPVFFLVVGYLLGLKLAGETAGVISSLVFLFFSFYAIKWYDINVAQKEARRARIVRKITS